MTRSPFPTRLLPLLALLLLLPRCEILVLSSNPAGSPYRSEHFTIYYPEAVFSGDEMVVIADRKEKLLQHINSYLGTGYDGVIEVFIGDSIRNPHALLNESAYETPGYVLGDDGHETAHIVTFHEWGYAWSSFIKEGMAEAASVSPVYDPDPCVKLVQRWRSDLSQIAPVDLETRIREDITVPDAFIYTRFEYDRAGAFMHYLKGRFGMSAVETWYRDAVALSSIREHDGTFRASFGVSLDSVIVDFVADVYARL